jgi:predicted dehydrogenase
MTIRIAMIGCGNIALGNHVPGIALCPDAELIALCDTSSTVLSNAAQATGVERTYLRWEEVIEADDIDAVIVCTPNYVHAPISIAAAAAGKHVLCEKPLAMSFEESVSMLRAAEEAGIRHMTAFTYRFVPAMHYMHHLVRSGAVGQPYHFRAQRFQDWGVRSLGWRQQRSLAGSGELGDMLSHRIDFGHWLLGPIDRLVAQQRRFIDVRDGLESDLDDWVAIIGEFNVGATAVMESSKLTTGRNEGARSHDFCEVNGSEGTVIYRLEDPRNVQIGRAGGSALEQVAVPPEFLVWPGSPRDPDAGDPLKVFRYDQDVEFITAIREGRPCEPSFADGVRAQAVMQAAMQSAAEYRWVDVPREVNA